MSEGHGGDGGDRRVGIFIDIRNKYEFYYFMLTINFDINGLRRV